MSSSVLDPFADVPFRNVKAGQKRGEGVLHKLNPQAGEVLDLARETVRLEPKQMADAMGISYSLVQRGLNSKDHLSFHRLYELSDDFWTELLVAIAKRRGVAVVRLSLDIPDRKAR